MCNITKGCGVEVGKLLDISDSNLGSRAYVIVDQANCLYKPDPAAAIRCSPSLGSEVVVLQEKDGWALVRFCGLEAWSVRENLGSHLAAKQDAVIVGSLPEVTGLYTSAQPCYLGEALEIETGPRGGRFVRTSSGFRRYL